MKKSISLAIVVSCFVMITANSAFSQQDLPPKSKEGTFQFIVHNSKISPAFTTDVLVLIEEKRKTSEDVYYKLNEDVTIFIPSIQKIESEDFKSLELYSY